MEDQLDLVAILLESGIVVKSVLLILIACSVSSWATIFSKRSTFKKVEKQNKDFLNFFESNKDDFDLLNKDIGKYPQSVYAHVFRYAYLEIQQGQKADKTNHERIEMLERAIQDASNEVNGLLELKLAGLASVGSITPFIGLFGTVWGIIDSFAALSTGGGSIEAVAPGIAEALVATAVGLFAAIPAVWFFNLFTSRIQTFNSEMDSFAQKMLNSYQRSLPKG